MRLQKIIQGSEQWHAMRAKHIGASEAPVIMGVDAYGRTLRDIIAVKLGIKEAPVSSYAMQQGHEKEAIALDKFHEKYGIRFMRDMQAFNDDYPFMTASLDGIDFARENICEVKYCRRELFDKVRRGVCPKHFYAQLQHALAVTGLDSACLIAISSDDEIAHMEVERCADYIGELVEKARSAYAFIESGEPPAADSKEKLLQDLENKGVETNDEAVHTLFCQIADLDAKVKSMNEELKALKCDRENRLSELMELVGGVPTSGFGYSIKPVVSKGAVDYSIIPELSGVDLEQYRKAPRISWKVNTP